MRLRFSGEMFEWRGPAPFHFIRVPDAESAIIRDVSALVSYGWGVIPATVTIGNTRVSTSLFPKDGGYLVPVKNALRIPERLSIGESVDVSLEIAD